MPVPMPQPSAHAHPPNPAMTLITNQHRRARGGFENGVDALVEQGRGLEVTSGVYGLGDFLTLGSVSGASGKRGGEALGGSDER